MRNSALALWLAASGCGSDGGDDGPEPGNDAATSTDSGAVNDAGSPQDSSAPDSAITDSGADGGTDSGTSDAGASDAGNPELAEALKTEGVVVTMRRVELVLQAFCRAYAACESSNEGECVSMSMADWSDPTIYTDPDENLKKCRDATLDVACCAATTPCDQLDSCKPLQDIEATLCPEEDAGT